MSAIVEIVSLAAPVHRPVVRKFRHERQDLSVGVVRKYPIKFEMEKWLFDRARVLD